MNILVIDDEPDICISLSKFLNRLGHSVSTAKDGEEGLKTFHSGNFDLIITDIRMPVMDGLELLRRVKTVERSPIDVIVFTGHGDMDNAVKALQFGAYDYLQKPINIKELAITIERSEEYTKLRNNYRVLKDTFEQKIDEAVHSCKGEAQRLREAYLAEIGLGNLYVFSEGMRQVLAQAEKYSADRSTPVLIEGESGTGKELIARYVHHFNPQNNQAPFVAINCGAFSESLIESELFGHEGGAFTGATSQGRKGRLEAAHGGTLFLDEIGEMPFNLQVKLLRILEDKKLVRLGGVKEIPIDIRIICATNKDLQQETDNNTFRLDLYYRISVGNIKIPPLRDRTDAIMPFAHRFASRAFKRHGKQFRKFTKEAERRLQRNSWPGNVRQIKNCMERLAILKTDGYIDTEDLSFIAQTKNNPSLITPLSAGISIENDEITLPENGMNLDEHTKKVIIAALKKFQGNQSRTAHYLGLTRRRLQGRIKKWNIQNA